MAKQPERYVTRVWRGSGATASETCVEWLEIMSGSSCDRKLHDCTRPASPEFHAAMDELAPHGADPVGLRPREVKLERKDDQLLVMLHGQKAAEGFNGPVHLHVPKQVAEGHLLPLVELVMDAALRFVDGERGQIDLFDERREGE